MTPEEIQAIRERATKATAGPWKVFEKVHETDKPFLAERLIGTAWDHPQLKGPAHVVTMGYCKYEPHHRVIISEADAEFIAHSRVDVDKLLGEVDRLRAVLDSVMGVINGSYGVSGWHMNGDIATWGELGLDTEVAEALEGNS